MFSIAVVQTKVISCNSANKSCLLQVVHTKAIAALTQFCDFLCNSGNRLLFTMKQATMYYVAFQIALISFRLFTFDWECIKQ